MKYKLILIFSLLFPYMTFACVGQDPVINEEQGLLVLLVIFSVVVVVSIIRFRTKNPDKSSGWVILKSLLRGMIVTLLSLLLASPLFFISSYC